jgi:hypothetical protein
VSLLPLSAHLPGSDVGDCNAVPAARPDGPVVVGEVDQRVAERVGNGFLARVSDGQCGRSRSRESAHRGSGVPEGGEGLDVVVFARLEAGRARTPNNGPHRPRYRSTAPRSPSPVTSEPPILPPPIRRASSASGAKDRAPTTPARQPRTSHCRSARPSERLRDCSVRGSATPGRAPARRHAEARAAPPLGSSCGCRGGSPVLPC